MTVIQPVTYSLKSILLKTELELLRIREQPVTCDRINIDSIVGSESRRGKSHGVSSFQITIQYRKCLSYQILLSVKQEQYSDASYRMHSTFASLIST